MRGIVSFHPIDETFFGELIAPLAAGRKVNPEEFLAAAERMRKAEWLAERYRIALAELLTSLEPPEAQRDGPLWQRLRSRLERYDHKPEPTARLIDGKIEPELHLRGRPFLITEGSSDRVSQLVQEYHGAADDRAVEALILEQLVRIDPALPGRIEPALLEEPSSEMSYRTELLAELRSLFDLGRAARQGGSWKEPDCPTQDAIEALPRILPWRAVSLHSRAQPCWIGRDVDGLETICRAADVEPPDCLTSAARLFRELLTEFPQVGEGLGLELRDERGLGAFVPPERMRDLLAFLNTEGSRVIRAAARHGEGPACATLLRKIRECAEYAERLGRGYLEASGIDPPGAPERL